MPQVKVFVPGRPVAMPRMTQRSKYSERMRNHEVWPWRENIGWSITAQRDSSWPLTCDVKLGLDFHVADPSPRRLPDLDNLAKSVKDALKGIVYVDDSQVCEYLPPFRRTVATPMGVSILVEW